MPVLTENIQLLSNERQLTKRISPKYIFWIIELICPLC